MTAPRCTRCGQPFDLRCPDDTRCAPCQREVDRVIAADEKRRTPRFPVKDFTRQAGVVL